MKGCFLGSKLGSMQFYRALVVLTVVLSCLGTAAAQITEIRTVGDKTVYCERSGLSSDVNDCGVRSDWYAYVFVGSISAITPMSNDEKELQIIPEEVFHGTPATPLTVLTSQGECLPKLGVGDRRLFSLREKENEPIVLDYYGNDSRSVAEAQEQIEILRRLENIGDFAILRGRVMQGTRFEGQPVPFAHVIANRESDDIQFVSTAGADGRYEFQPLPPGKYKITVHSAGSTQPDDDGVELSRGSCWDLTLTRSPHARLGGHVHRSDGSSMANVDVIIMNADNSWFTTSQTDARGSFTFDSLKPGEYVVGINLPGAPAWENAGGAGEGVAPQTASLYYGRTAVRSDALVIKLATNEKRDDLDFIAPTQ